MTAGRTPQLCVLGMGGSVDETLPPVGDALRRRVPGLAITLVDLQPCHLRAPGRMRGAGADRTVPVTPHDLGLGTPVKSWALNLGLQGGALAYRRMIARAGAILDRLGADAVLCVHDRLYPETAFLHAARMRGLPTALLQEGPFCVIGHGAANAPGLRLKYALAPLAQRLGLMPAMPDYGTFGHDLVMAASESYRARWIGAGVPAERIAVTGVPRYDGLPTARAERAAAETSRAAADAPEIAVLLQPFGRHGKVAPAAAAAALATLAEGLTTLLDGRQARLIVRPHPRAPADADCLTQHLRGPWSLDDPARPVPARLATLDLAIGFYSSALLEAAAVGVPALCVRLPSAAFAEPGEAAKQERLRGLGLPVAVDAAELAAKAGALLDGAGPATTPEIETGPLDGGAARRVAAALAPLLVGTPAAAIAAKVAGG